MSYLDDLIDFAKSGGPYIGPKGGKWADPQHKIPWKEDAPKTKKSSRKKKEIKDSWSEKDGGIERVIGEDRFRIEEKKGRFHVLQEIEYLGKKVWAGTTNPYMQPLASLEEAKVAVGHRFAGEKAPKKKKQPGRSIPKTLLPGLRAAVKFGSVVGGGTDATYAQERRLRELGLIDIQGKPTEAGKKAYETGRVITPKTAGGKAPLSADKVELDLDSKMRKLPLTKKHEVLTGLADKTARLDAAGREKIVEALGHYVIGAQKAATSYRRTHADYKTKEAKANPDHPVTALTTFVAKVKETIQTIQSQNMEKSMSTYLEELIEFGGGEPLEKAGPYIGPKGGKYKDPEHKIPWSEEKGKTKGKKEVGKDSGTKSVSFSGGKIVARKGKSGDYVANIHFDSGKRLPGHSGKTAEEAISRTKALMDKSKGVKKSMGTSYEGLSALLALSGGEPLGKSEHHSEVGANFEEDFEESKPVQKSLVDQAMEDLRDPSRGDGFNQPCSIEQRLSRVMAMRKGRMMRRRVVHVAPSSNDRSGHEREMSHLEKECPQCQTIMLKALTACPGCGIGQTHQWMKKDTIGQMAVSDAERRILRPKKVPRGQIHVEDDS